MLTFTHRKGQKSVKNEKEVLYIHFVFNSELCKCFLINFLLDKLTSTNLEIFARSFMDGHPVYTYMYFEKLIRYYLFKIFTQLH